MNRLKHLLYLALSYIFLLSCTSNAKTTGSSPSTIDTLSIETKDAIKIKRFHGYNSTIMPYYLTSDYDSLYPAIKELSPKILRFPGGTIANFYHPEEPAYGMKIETVEKMKDLNMGSLIVNQNKRVEKDNLSLNYKVPFAQLCKELDASVLLVANLLDGSVKEAISMIDYFKEQEIKIDGVELGNEYYLKSYREEFPTVDEYIRRSKKFAKAIREKYPDLKMGVIAAPNEQTKEVSIKREFFYRKWNSSLAKHKYYDAIIIHHYIKSEDCLDEKEETKLFQCASKNVNSYTDKKLEKIINGHQDVFGDSIKIWFTEWNLRETRTHFGNTFLQAIHALDFVLNLTKLNTQYDRIIEHSIYHNLCAGGAFALVNPLETENKHDQRKFIKRTAYYTFKMLEEVLGVKDISYIPISENLDLKGIDIGAFYSQSNKQVHLFIINRTKKEHPMIDLNIDGVKIDAALLMQLKSDKLSSGIGSVNHQDGKEVGNIELNSENVRLDNWKLQAFTINRITIDLEDK